MVAVLGAIGVGVALPLLFGDGRPEGPRELSRVEVERRLGEELVVPTGRAPDSVTCRRAGEDAFVCTATYRGTREGEAALSGYELTVADHER